MYLTEFQVVSLYPTFYSRSVTSVLGLGSRPGGLFPVKAMKADVCAGKLGSGQTTRHDERPAVFGDIDGISHVELLRSRGCDIIITEYDRLP